VPGAQGMRCGDRLTHDFVHRTLDAFNPGALDASEAASRLGISRSQLFRLRQRRLNSKPVRTLSGGNHLPPPWPAAAQAGRAASNFQLITGQLASRHGVTRHRSPVAAAFAPSDTT